MEEVSKQKDLNAKTCRTFIHRCDEKPALTADRSSLEILYSPAISRRDYTRQTQKSLADKLFNGSMSRMMLNFMEEVQLNEDELEELAQSFFDRSPHGAKIRLHIGSALDIAPALGMEFDLVFIDGDKREYPDYYRMLMGDGGTAPLVHSGSVLVADNILWSGKVVQPIARSDRHTQAVVEFNRMVSEDPRVENVIIPLRDGLNLIRVK